MFKKLSLVLFLAMPFAASANGVFLGGAVGNNQLEDGDIDQEESDTAFKIFVGYKFTDNIAIELMGMDLGSPEFEEELVDLHGTFSYSSQAVALSGIAIWPVSDIVDIYGKLGVFRWNTDFDYTVSNGVESLKISDDDAGFDFNFGVGVGFNIGEGLSLTLEYESFDYTYEISDLDYEFGLDNSVISVGLKYSF